MQLRHLLMLALALSLVWLAVYYILVPALVEQTVAELINIWLIITQEF